MEGDEESLEDVGLTVVVDEDLADKVELWSKGVGLMVEVELGGAGSGSGLGLISLFTADHTSLNASMLLLLSLVALFSGTAAISRFMTRFLVMLIPLSKPRAAVVMLPKTKPCVTF